MQIRVVTDSEIKVINKVAVGDLLLCDDGIFRPVKSILITCEHGTSFRLSNNLQFTVPKRFRIKTDKGFKYPEMWDCVPLQENLKPIVTNIKTPLYFHFLYDILIDGNLISPEGVIFKFGE